MSDTEPTKPGSPEYFVHESSYVDEGAVIGKGTRVWHFCHVLAGASIGERCSFGQNCSIAAGVVIGNNVKVQNNVSIYEGTTIEDDVFLGPSCVLTNVTNPRSQVLRRALYEPTLLRRGCSIGANATILCGITLGRYAFVAAGAVVAKDVPDYALMVGIPARQKGWMSRHGHLLGKPDADGVMVCPESGLRYQVKSVDCESLIVNRETDDPLTTTHEPLTTNHEPRTTNHEPRTTQVLRCLDLDEEAPLPEDLAVGKVVYGAVKL